MVGIRGALKVRDKNKELQALFSNINQENFNFESYLVHFLKETIFGFDLRG